MYYKYLLLNPIAARESLYLEAWLTCTLTSVNWTVPAVIPILLASGLGWNPQGVTCSLCNSTRWRPTRSRKYSGLL